MKDIKIIDDIDYKNTDVSLEYLTEEKKENEIDLDATKDYTELFKEGFEEENE